MFLKLREPTSIPGLVSFTTRITMVGLVVDHEWNVHIQAHRGKS